MKIPINKIKPDQKQPRKTFDNMGGLTRTIKRDGLLQPILVDKKYNLIDGERRFRAAKLAGLKEIPAIVHKKKSNKLLLQCLADVHHNRVPTLERDEAWLELYKEIGEPTKRDFAKYLSVGINSVNDALERATFVPRVQDPYIKEVPAHIITETRPLKDKPELREKIIKEFATKSTGRGDAVLRGVVKEALKDNYDDSYWYKREADEVIRAIKVVLEKLDKGLMLKIPKTQAVVLSGYIVELQKHLKTWEAEEVEIVQA